MIVKSYLSKISYSNNSNYYDIIFKSDVKNKKTIFKILANDAKKIALANEGIKSENLKTYDLFLNLLLLLEINVLKIEIHKQSYSPKSILFLNYKLKNLNLDLDYVDAIILSSLTLCPLYIDSKYFCNSATQNISGKINNENHSIDNVLRLKQTLRKLIQKEEYEYAAKIRDKIKKFSS